MSVDNKELEKYLSPIQRQHIEHAEGLPGIQTDLNLFKLKLVSEFVLGALLVDINHDTPVEPHSFGLPKVYASSADVHKEMHVGRLCSVSVNQFWQMLIEVWMPMEEPDEEKLILNGDDVRVVDIEWWQQADSSGQMDPFYPENPITFVRESRFDTWKPVSDFSTHEQIEALMLIAKQREMLPPYADQ